MKRALSAFFLPAVILCLAALPSTAQTATAPYEKQLLRLAEILGSIHYLRNLCGEEASTWREQMSGLLDAEAPSSARREKLVASFNHGYRAFSDTYPTCTPQALDVVQKYMIESATLANDIAVRYGN